MKKLYILFLLTLCVSASAQDFDKNLATARTSYSSGDLENARFAMESMLRDLDMAIGKEILKMLPAQLGSLKADEKADNLTGGTGITGLFVHRTYGTTPKIGDLEIINNSPLMNSIGAMINTPVLGGMMRDENQKIVKIQGYKSLLNKTVDSETGKTNYELQMPLNNTLVTLKVNDTNEAEITGFANSLPLAKIVQIAQ
jgi:hypothetical protein